MGNLGAPELLIIAVVVVLLFGSKKLPEMARSVGRSAKILKAETSGLRDEQSPNRSDGPASA
jgi:sec-independent protein translocase protein TatA